MGGGGWVGGVDEGGAEYEMKGEGVGKGGGGGQSGGEEL